MTDINLADAWEAVCDSVPERVALICDGRTITYAELEARANRLAHWMAGNGVAEGDHVGVYMQSSFEYIEVSLAAYKVRAVPININFRYVADELIYLFNDAELVGVVFHPDFSETLDSAKGSCPALRWGLATGSDYEVALAGHSPTRDFPPRSGDDHYVIYTGGTTGMPKGVVWRQDDAFFSCLGLHSLSPPAVASESSVAEPINPSPTVFMVLAPLMHAAGGWAALSNLFTGNTVLLWRGPLDGAAVWRTVAEHKVETTALVGDSMMRPLLDGWESLAAKPDVSSLRSVSSGGAPLAAALRDQFLESFPSVILAEGYGSSETGAQATRLFAPGSVGAPEPSYAATNGVVLDEATHLPVEPGSGHVGRTARTGRIPIGYYNDPVKTAATFVDWDGRRWVLTGDMATVNEDGTIRIIGRGSLCINSGGEKIFPEEVEAALRHSREIYDVVVVGVPDERWGQAPVAVVALAAGATVTEDELRDRAREHLAGYKVPRRIMFVDEVVRSPSGKADYRWGAEIAVKRQSEK